ncbi:hypothetical protein VN97_g8576 [Penicillium thymicola]|uniref:Uncharacterized protein n=1 Tax=Penicillium thymicola TaxID=293382 RepID=A0AAI9TD52_PENTH|nr:hypothetical protein VN97_g8576 [Penicillium thymicola]
MPDSTPWSMAFRNVHEIGLLWAVHCIQLPGEAEQCFREALRIVQLPANSGNYISGVLTARIWWRLSGILATCEESQTMQAKALEYLEARIGHKVPFEDVGKAFEDLVFYWSR